MTTSEVEELFAAAVQGAGVEVAACYSHDVVEAVNVMLGVRNDLLAAQIQRCRIVALLGLWLRDGFTFEEAARNLPEADRRVEDRQPTAAAGGPAYLSGTRRVQSY